MLCLRVATDPGWVADAVRDLDALLMDHAHCEMKAASNALSLAARYPVSHEIVRCLTDLAREEIDHFQRVLDLLTQRGLRLGAPPVDAYAAELRRAVGALPRADATHPLVERLLVAALIEARSCERFKLLAASFAKRGDAERDLRALHEELFVAEARHYRTFVDLATQVAHDDAGAVALRLDTIAELEGRIVAALAGEARRATIHG
jgi:tRNA-(ms[2]io[6]A)-hydroxylase